MKSRMMMFASFLFAAFSVHAGEIERVLYVDWLESTPSGHCSGRQIYIFIDRDQLFGNFYIHDGLCGDPRQGLVYKADFDSEAGKLEFYGFNPHTSELNGERFGSLFHFSGVIDGEKICADIVSYRVDLVSHQLYQYRYGKEHLCAAFGVTDYPVQPERVDFLKRAESKIYEVWWKDKKNGMTPHGSAAFHGHELKLRSTPAFSRRSR